MIIIIIHLNIYMAPLGLFLPTCYLKYSLIQWWKKFQSHLKLNFISIFVIRYLLFA